MLTHPSVPTHHCRLRNAELKHGRLAMLACLGFITPELVQNPSGFTCVPIRAEPSRDDE